MQLQRGAGRGHRQRLGRLVELQVEPRAEVRHLAGVRVRERRPRPLEPVRHVEDRGEDDDHQVAGDPQHDRGDAGLGPRRVREPQRRVDPEPAEDRRQEREPGAEHDAARREPIERGVVSVPPPVAVPVEA